MQTGNVVAVLLPVEVAADRPVEVLEVRDVVAQRISDLRRFLRGFRAVEGGGGQIMGDLRLAFSHVDHDLHLVGHLQKVFHSVFEKVHVLHGRLALDTVLKRN